MWLTIKSESRLVLVRWRFYFVVSVALSFGLATASTLAGLGDAVVLRPLRVASADRLVAFQTQPAGTNSWTQTLFSPEEVRLLQTQRIPSITRIAGVRSSGNATIVLSANRLSVRVRAATVTPGFFQLFELPDVWQGASREPSDAAVVSWDLWERHLRPSGLAVGDSVSIPDFDPKTFGTRPRPLRIGAIAPRGFHLPGDTELWLSTTPLEAHLQHFALIGLLQPGVSTAALDALNAGSWLAGARRDVKARPLRDTLVPNESWVLIVMLLATVGLLLTVWCQAALFVAGEALSQRRALATRLALGASRLRLVAEQMVGPLYIVVAAWPLSVLIAAWLQRDIVSVLPLMAGRRAEYGITSSLFAALALVLFLLAQAFVIDRVIRTRVRRIRQGLGMMPAGAHVPSKLAAVSAGVSLAFLYVSSLLGTSFHRTLRYDYGFDTRSLVVVHTSAMVAGLRSPEEQRGRQAALDDYIRRLPGVTGIVRLNGAPFGTYDVALPVTAAGPAAGDSRTATAKVRATAAGLFETLGVPIVAGRDFRHGELDNAPVAIVTRGLAHALWPARSTLGSALTVRGRSYQVVGVVQDFSDRAGPGVAPTVSPQVFLPVSDGSDILVRTSGNAEQVLQAILGYAEGYSAYLRADGFSYDAIRARLAMNEEAHAWFMGVIAAGAGLIAAIGGIVTVAQASAQGLRSAGIRLGLGATYPQALLAVARVPLMWLMAGSLTGIATGLLMGKVLETSIRNVDATEPLAVALCLGISLLALAMSLIRPSRSLRRLDCAALLKEDR